MKVLACAPDPDLLMENTGEDRKEGVHLSDILVRMAWEKNRKYHPDAPKDFMVFEQGFTWETVLERALAARQKNRAGERPPQMQEDGVWCSADWIGCEGKTRIHEEWKSTKKSIKSAEEKVQEWLPQAKSYVRALLRRKLIDRPITRFRAWFINGDYSYESKGSDLTLLRDYLKIDIEFDRRELDENWSGIISSGRRFGLLKQESKPWDDRPSLNQRVAARASVRRGKAPDRSRGKAAVVTFPRGKRTPRPSDAA